MASHTAFGNLYYQVQDLVGSVSSISGSVSSLATAAGHQPYKFYTASAAFATDMYALLGTHTDNPYIYIYTAEYVAVSITSAPTYSGYSLALTSLGASITVELPTGGPSSMVFNVVEAEPVSFLYNTDTSWRMIPGLYPNNSLVPVA